MVEDMDPPTAGAGQLLVDVKAASLNFPDVLITQGKYQFKPDLPFVPGGEGAGVIAVVGDDVRGFAVGDRILFAGGWGAFAEQVAIPATSAQKIDDAMGYKSAAALTITYATTIHALKQRANIQTGETLVILGAAGGVGLAAVEIGKAMGARVIACASSDEKLAVCREHGADDCINYTSENLKDRIKELTGKKGADVVYDPVGGDYSEQALRAMAYNGRFLVIGFAAGDIPHIPLNLVLLKQCQIVGVFWGAWTMMNPKGHIENTAELFAMFKDGRINPRVDDEYSLDDIKEAYACLTGRRAKGKVIISI